MTLDSGLQVGALACLLSTIALDVGSTRLAHGTAVRALRDGTAFLVDMLERPIMVLTVAHAVATNTGLASVFLAVDYHDDVRSGGGNDGQGRE